jgi:hypothetical protein
LLNAAHISAVAPSDAGIENRAPGDHHPHRSRSCRTIASTIGAAEEPACLTSPREQSLRLGGVVVQRANEGCFG